MGYGKQDGDIPTIPLLYGILRQILITHHLEHKAIIIGHLLFADNLWTWDDSGMICIRSHQENF